MKKLGRTKIIKSLGAAMLIGLLITVFSCSQSSSSSGNSDTPQTNENTEETVSQKRIDNTKKLLTYLKKYTWISENYSVTYGTNDTEYDSSQAMTFTVNQNDTLTMYNPNGSVYRTFDISVNNLSSNPDEYEKPQFKIPNESEKILVFGIADCNTLETRGYDDIVMYITNDNTILPNRYYQNFMKQTNNNNPGNGPTSAEIINTIKGNWNYTGLVAGQNRTVNVTINDNNITLTWAGTPRTASYTVSNGKINISYVENAGGNANQSTTYSASFDVTLNNNSFEISGSDSAQVYGMFFGMVAYSTPYKITFTK